jgi:pentose-5-phosphate-3-epimerase
MDIRPIIPAIIPETYQQLEERLERLRNVVRRVQVDVMDGSYTDEASWPYVGPHAQDFTAGKPYHESLPFHGQYDYEIDLLLEHPEQHIHAWSLSGAMAVIVHVETVSDPHEIIALTQECRIECGVAIKPSSDIRMLAPYVGHVAFFQCMGNDVVGRNGMRLKETVYEKIREIKTLWPDVPVGVDIGVNEETLPGLVAAGVERFAVGSGVFGGSGDPASSVLLLEKLCGLRREVVSLIDAQEK